MLKSRMTRLILALCITLLLAMGAVSAQDSPSGDVTFIFWENSATARDGWNYHIAEFNELFPDITVNLLGVPGETWVEYLNGTATLVAGGEQPDIIWVATEGVRFLVGLDLIQPLDDLIAQDTTGELQAFLDDLAPAMADSMRVDGQLYFFPYSWNNMVVYYNKDLFDAAGIEYPNDDWTRDEFLAAAQAIAADTDGDGNIDRYGWAGSGSGIFFSAPWVLANGTNILTDDWCAPNLTDPGVVEAIQFIHNMIHEYQVSPIPGTLTSTPIQFANGQIGMFGGGHWGVPQMYAEGFTNYDVVPWPGNPDQTTIYGVDGFGMFRTARNPEAASVFLKYMTRESVQDVLVGGAEEGPLFNIPARRSVAEKMEQFLPDNQGIFYGSLDGNVELVPSPTRFNELGSIYDRYYRAIMANEMTVEEGLNAAQNELLSVVTC